MTNTDSPDYEVGYGKPPKQHQFPKGKSGNPNGRPKRPEGVSIRELLDTSQRGKNGSTISSREALVIRILNDAMSGNQKAFSKFINLMQLSGMLRKEAPLHNTGPIIVPTKRTSEPSSKNDMKTPKAPLHDSNHHVGYGRPPRAAQFKKEVSGNPRGRKKSDENLVMVFKRLANRLVKVSFNGATQTMSMAQAVIMKNLKEALNQDQSAMSNILRLAEVSGEYLDWSNSEFVGHPIVVPEPRYDIDAVLEEHGVGRRIIPSRHQKDVP